MKTFGDFMKEEKQTYIVQGQYGEKFHTHEIEAKSHDHAKKLYKQKAKEAGHKYPTVHSAYTKAEHEEKKRKDDAWRKEREAKIAKTHAEMDKNKEYWDARQKDYDSQRYKGD